MIKLLLALAAVACGVAVAFGFDTGSLTHDNVAGLGIICAGIATCV